MPPVHHGTRSQARAHALDSTSVFAIVALVASALALGATALNFYRDLARERRDRAERINALLEDAFDLLESEQAAPTPWRRAPGLTSADRQRLV